MMQRKRGMSLFLAFLMAVSVVLPAFAEEVGTEPEGGISVSEIMSEKSTEAMEESQAQAEADTAEKAPAEGNAVETEQETEETDAPEEEEPITAPARSALIPDPDVVTVTYRFYLREQDTDPVSEQIVKEGDPLYEPKVPAEQDGKTFTGWYEQDGDTAFAGFGTVGKLSEAGTVELYARYTDVIYLYYHDQDGYLVRSEKVTANTEVTIYPDAPLIETNALTTCHDGWALKAGSTDDVSGTYRMGSESVHLYPIIKEGYWVTFESNGGTEIAKQFIDRKATGDGKKATKPSDPYRKGYVFAGWYTDSACTDAYDFDSDVTKAITIYAKWEPATDTVYTVVYWIEYQTDVELDLWDYKWIAKETRVGTTGENTEYDPDYIFNSPYSLKREGYELERAEEETIAADGTTEINIYYRCQKYNISFRFEDSEGNKVLLEYNDVKYSASMSKVWETILSYETDDYKIFDGTHRFTYSYESGTSFCEDPTELATMPARNEVWVRNTMAKNNCFYRCYLETLEGEAPEGNEVVKNTSARVQYGTVTDSRTYYLKMAGGFTAYGGAVAFPDRYDGFTAQWKLSDGNAASFNNYGLGFAFHAKTYYGVDNVWGGVQYEYSYGTAGCYLETDGYLDIYYTRNRYDLIFHENGGEELEDAKVYYEKTLDSYDPAVSDADNYTVGESTMTNDGGQKFVFAGWYTDIELTDAFTFDITMPAHNIDLYAKWEPIKYTAAFDANGGSEVAAQSGITYGDTAAKPADPTRKGYIFLGWTQNGRPYNFSSGVTDDITLVAEWRSVDAYPVTYDLGGGSGTVPTDDQQYYEGAGVTVRSEAKITPPAGKVFLGWKSDGDGKLYYANGLALMPRGGLTLTAQWGNVPQTVQLTYDFNYASFGIGQTNTEDDGSTVYGYVNNETVMLVDFAAFGAAPKGYTFGGWYLDAACGGDSVKAVLVDQTGQKSQNVVYAMWIAMESRISYDPNGGTGNMPPTEGKVGDQVAVSDNRFTYEGYTFIGWNTRPDGSGTSYAPEDIYRLGAEELTLYAIWEKVESRTTTDPQPRETASGGAPKTGDGSPVLTWTLSALTASAGLVWISISRRRNGHVD